MKEIITIGTMLSWLGFGIFLFTYGFRNNDIREDSHIGLMLIGFLLMACMSIGLLTYVHSL